MFLLNLKHKKYLQFQIFIKSGTYILKGHASLPKGPLIGGLFICPKNPSAPSALIRPLNVYGV